MSKIHKISCISLATIFTLTLTSSSDSQELSKTGKLASETAIGLGIMIAKQDCRSADAGPPMAEIIVNINNNRSKIDKETKDLVSSTFSESELQALDAFLNTDEGQALAKNIVELIGGLSVIGTTNLCGS